MKALSYEAMRALSDDELVERYDATAVHTVVGLSFIRQEIALREQARHTEAMLRYTRWITLMTVVVTVATILNFAVSS